MSDSLKRYISNIYNVLDNIDDVGLGVAEFAPEMGLRKSRDLVQSDLVSFILYLSASDGEISYEEREFIEENFEVDFSVDEIKQIIREKNIHSIEFENMIPLSVKMVVAADNKIVDAGISNSTGNAIMYDFFKLVGQALIACDNDVDEKELKDLSIYLQNIKDYINSNSKSTNRVVNDPNSDAKAACNLLVEYKAEMPNISTRSNSTNNGGAVLENERAPWDTVYFTQACPFCGKKKVRYAKWEDKMFSTAFWGIYSYKLHCAYKCDNCKEMWS